MTPDALTPADAAANATARQEQAENRAQAEQDYTAGAAIAWQNFTAAATKNLRQAAGNPDADPAAAIAAELERLTGTLAHLARNWHRALWT